jgi:iron complex outermembrane receptor protein
MNTQTTRKYRKNRLAQSLALALALPIAASAFAQQPPSAPASTEEEETQLDEVVVTGSRIKRSEVEGPAPVVVLTAEDIEKEGFITVYDALNTLTQFTGSVQNELNQNGFTPNGNFLNLRGLGPGYQLVLINGRRAADYPLPYNSQSNATNIGNIPAAAIERIEILTGGASAIYGSDAVAGVVNIILKENYSGDLLSARIGTTTRGGGDQWQLQWVGGKTGDNWSLTYAFEALHRDQIFASERDFMDSYLDDPSRPDEDVNPPEGLLAIDLFNSSRVVPDLTDADLNGDGVSNRADDRIEACARFEDFDPYVFETSSVYTGMRCGWMEYPATQVIRNADDNQSMYLSGTWDFTDNIQGFAQFFHTRAKATLASGSQFLSTPQFYTPNPDMQSTVLIPFGVPGAYLQLQRIFTPAETGGTESLETIIKERSTDAAVGLRGTIGRWDWDATLSHSRYRINSDTPRFLEQPLLDYFLGAEIPGGDPFGFGLPAYEFNVDRFFNPITPETFASLNTVVKDEANSKVTQGSLVFSGDLWDMEAGPVGMAAVLEWASQSYEVNPDERTDPNYTGPERIFNLTSTGGGGDRDRQAFGVEFSVPVHETLKWTLAGRYDHYDDASAISGAKTWQTGLEWRPTDNLLFRASHGTSFRAPDMHYIYAEESGFFTGVFDEYRCRRDFGGGAITEEQLDECRGDINYVYTVFGTRHGDPNLEAEKGKSTTVGLVWDPMDNMSFSLDYYNIELRDAVGDISGLLFRNEADCLTGTDRDGNAVDPNSAFCQFYLGLVERAGVDDFNDDEVVQFESFPINQSLNRTSGLDASFTYEKETERYGNFNFSLQWTHVLELEFQEFDGSELEDIRDHMQYFNFRSRVAGAVVWELDDWTTGVYMTRWGSLPNWAETDRIGPHFQWNVNVARRFGDKAEVTLYVNNIFDTIHPQDDTFNTYPFFWRAYSPVGREVFLQFDWKFN